MGRSSIVSHMARDPRESARPRSARRRVREPKLIKVRLTDEGKDVETLWAADLGPAPGEPEGTRQVRLVNVPFLHAKPTWGDVILVQPAEDGFPTWDSEGTPWSRIGERILEDGGRYAMIVDYTPEDSSDRGVAAAFEALDRACDLGRADLSKADIVCEGCYGATTDEPGRAYLAVKDDLTPAAVMKRLRGASLPCEVLQIHPNPEKPRRTRSRAKKKGRRS